MAVSRSCDVCGFYKQALDGSSLVRRYSLLRSEADRRGRETNTRGAGGIDLCDECWEKVGKPKMHVRTRKRVEGSRGRT